MCTSGTWQRRMRHGSDSLVDLLAGIHILRPQLHAAYWSSCQSGLRVVKMISLNFHRSSMPSVLPHMAAEA